MQSGVLIKPTEAVHPARYRTMVGFDPKLNKNNNIAADIAAISGAATGATTRFLLQPFDVIKIRFQLQLEPISKRFPGSKYQSMHHCMRTMIREEGMTSLWKGHIPAQVLSILYGLGQFATFEILTKQAWKSLPQDLTNDWKPMVHFVCGGCSGFVATSLTMPFDVIRTRLVSQGEPKVYSGLIHAANTMYVKEGARALYKGLSPSLIQIVPYTGVQFSVYTYVSSLLKNIWNLQNYPVLAFLESLTAGMIAGLTAKTFIYPFDVVKKRLQVQGFEVARLSFGKVNRYTGLINCIHVMRTEEGILSFYKGLIPSSIKAALACGMNFAFYELFSQFLHDLRLVGS